MRSLFSLLFLKVVFSSVFQHEEIYDLNVEGRTESSCPSILGKSKKTRQKRRTRALGVKLNMKTDVSENDVHVEKDAVKDLHRFHRKIVLLSNKSLKENFHNLLEKFTRKSTDYLKSIGPENLFAGFFYRESQRFYKSNYMDLPKVLIKWQDSVNEESYCMEYERHLRLEETLEDALEAARKSQRKNGHEADLKDAFSKVIYAARKFIVFFRSHHSSFYGLYPELLGSTISFRQR